VLDVFSGTGSLMTFFRRVIEPLLSNAETRSISAENPMGEKGGRAKASVPDEETLAAMMESMAPTLPPDFKEHPSSMLGAGWKVQPATETYSTPFLGYPLYRNEPGEAPRHGLYRWHVLDPVRFKQDLKVTVQALGWWPNRKFEPLTDDIASVAYWYQAGPHAPFPELPPVHGRWSR